jgi:5-methylcytosine-specific restriction endonuclease McrA
MGAVDSISLTNNERVVLAFFNKWQRGGFIETSKGTLMALIRGNNRNVNEVILGLKKKHCIARKSPKTGGGLMRFTLPTNAPNPPQHPFGLRNIPAHERDGDLIEYKKNREKRTRCAERVKTPTKIPAFKSEELSKRLKVFAKTDGICFYCQISEATTIDHMIPKVKGGSNRIDNLIGACYGCNQEKGALTCDEYLVIVNKRFSKIERV